MREYENYSREELIQRIKELETNLSQSARNDAEIEEMSENLACQATQDQFPEYINEHNSVECFRCN